MGKGQNALTDEEASAHFAAGIDQNAASKWLNNTSSATSRQSSGWKPYGAAQRACSQELNSKRLAGFAALREYGNCMANKMGAK